MNVRAAVFRGPRRPLSIETLLLDPPGADEVLVRMVASGVCHSDLHVVDGDWSRPADVVLGHEGAGVIEALGPDVSGLAVGDVVVLAWTAPCAACPACRRGEPWLCADPRGGGHRLASAQVRLRRPDGSPVGAYSGIGTFAKRQVVAAEAAIRVDPRTPPEIAALVGCAVTTGVGAVLNTAAVQAGESVVVIGAGGVGLSSIMAAVMAGAQPVVAIDAAPEKLALAREAGASHAVNPEEARALVAQLSKGGADHVVEAIGLSETVELAIELTRPGGTTTLVGMTPQGHRATIDVYRFVEEGRRLLGSNYGSAVPARDFPRICDLYLDGRLPLDLLVTERIGLDDVESALEAMRQRHGARRVVLF
ncbi:MAG: alcohol dehydrogenase catalytic domain-containing protein [Chloroflexota bacterium]|nr:alcohol dehydrogenase catalytic domain-containing protein [Chloroflexota bacterium]